MPVQVIVLIGLSGFGKTALMEQAVRRLPHLKKVRSTTTRRWRSPEDDKGYEFISRLRFFWWLLTGHFVQWVVYDWNAYGTTQMQYTSIAQAGHIAILAMTEKGPRMLHAQGYEVRVVKIVAWGAKIREGREEADTGRVNELIADYTLINDFAEGGFDSAVNDLVTYIERAF